MKKLFTALFVLASSVLSLCAAPGELVVTPESPNANGAIVLTYTPTATQKWMETEDVFLYTCLELDKNGEWAKEKQEWSKCNTRSFLWTKKSDGTLTYTISNIKSYFGLTDEEVPQVSGMFIILKNEQYQTDDKYVALNASKKKEKFTGSVKFSVQVPAGTKEVWVAGTFGKEGDPLFWKHADAKLQLKKVDETHFEGTIKNVPADLHYLYVWGPRTDQSEYRFSHRPLGGRNEVNDKVEYWGDMTLNVTVPRSTTEVYVSGNFNNWEFSRMVDAGNNNWTFHVPPTSFDGNTIEYYYYYKNSAEAVESGAKRKVKFVGFSTQYDEIKVW
jgi:hypothetical protein